MDVLICCIRHINKLQTSTFLLNGHCSIVGQWSCSLYKAVIFTSWLSVYDMNVRVWTGRFKEPDLRCPGTLESKA